MSLNLDKSTWQQVRFGDVVNNVNLTVRDAKEAGIDRVIAMEHMDPGELKIQRWGSAEDGTTFTRRVKPGQTLFGKRRAYQRKVAYADFDAICSGDIYTFEGNETELLPEFLPFLVQSNEFFDHALDTSAGSLSPRTNWRDLANFEFGLPPLNEQRRIADLLWALERHRSEEHRLAEIHERVIGRFCVEAFDQMSTRFPSTTFSALGELRMGRQKAPKYATGVGSTPYLRVANIGVLELNLAEVDAMDFNERDLARYRLEPGDVVLTEGDIVSARNVGRPAVFQGEVADCAFQNTLIRFRPNAGADSMFYAALFEGMRVAGVFARAANTTTVAHLGLGRLSEVPLPAVPEQTQLAIGDKLRALLHARAQISSADAEIATLRSTLLSSVQGGR